jgi:hypothetical protein
VSETITTDDVDEYFINDEILIQGEYQKFVAELDTQYMACPVCKQHHKDSRFFLLENGQHLYIGKCCGRFALCEVNGEDNGMATDE